MKAYVWQHNNDPMDVLSGSVDPETRIITISLGGADGWLATAAPGEWSIIYRLTFADGSVLTWPEKNTDTIRVW